MPYKSVNELPDTVRGHLPKHAQDIYRKAYNNAWDQYKSPGKRHGEDAREETAHKVAWSAVKKEYQKDSKSGQWKKKGESDK